MNDRNSENESDLLEQVVGAWKKAPVEEPCPVAAVESTKRVLSEAMEKDVMRKTNDSIIPKGSESTRLKRHRHPLMRSLARIAACLAAVCVVGGVTWWCTIGNTAFAYVKVARGLGKELPSWMELATTRVDPRLVDQLETFYAAYSLKPDENVKLIPPPFMRERATYLEWVRTSEIIQLPEHAMEMASELSRAPLPDWISLTSMGWNLKPYGGQSYGRGSFHMRVEQHLQMGRAYMEGNADLIERGIEADIVWREEASPEEKVDGLQRELRDKLHWPVRLEVRTVKRPVIVAGGRFEHRRLPQYDDSWARFTVVELYGRRRREEPDSGPGGTGDFDEFLRWTSDFIGSPVVAGDITGMPKEITWLYGPRVRDEETGRRLFPLPDEESELVLQHLGEQTGLSFHLEEREVRMLFVERVAPEAD